MSVGNHRQWRTCCPSLEECVQPLLQYGSEPEPLSAKTSFEAIQDVTRPTSLTAPNYFKQMHRSVCVDNTRGLCKAIWSGDTDVLSASLLGIRYSRLVLRRWTQQHLFLSKNDKQLAIPMNESRPKPSMYPPANSLVVLAQKASKIHI